MGRDRTQSLVSALEVNLAELRLNLSALNGDGYIHHNEEAHEIRLKDDKPEDRSSLEARRNSLVMLLQVAKAELAQEQARRKAAEAEKEIPVEKVAEQPKHTWTSPVLLLCAVVVAGAQLAKAR